VLDNQESMVRVFSHSSWGQAFHVFSLRELRSPRGSRQF
jgi:hypothetical protein